MYGTKMVGLVTKSYDQAKTYNYGLACLRILACLQVIHIHYANGIQGSIEYLFLRTTSAAVPVFMIMAFLFTDPLALASKSGKLKSRLVSLYAPMLFWGIVYWAFYRLINLFFHAGLRDGFSVLFFQLVFGSDINPVMWFNFDLIIITIFLTIIYRVMKSRQTADFFLCILVVFCMWFQWSGANRALFEGVRYEILNPGMRLTQMVPFAVIGVFTGRLFRAGVKNCFVNWTIWLLSTGFLLWYIILGIGGWLRVYNSSDSYLSLETLLLGTTSTIAFGHLPYRGSENSKAIEVLKTCICLFAKRTMAVYAMHIAVGKIIYRIFLRYNIGISDFALCVVIFMTCYLLSEILCRLLGNSKWRVVVG